MSYNLKNIKKNKEFKIHIYANDQSIIHKINKLDELLRLYRFI